MRTLLSAFASLAFFATIAQAAPPVITQGSGPLTFTINEDSGPVSFLTWDKRFGGSASDYLRSAISTSDGGYLLVGHSSSQNNGDKTQTSQGGGDYWVVKVDANGTKVWDKTFGGAGTDELQSAIATSDGGYLLAGYSNSLSDGDKSQASQGGIDYWAVKIDANGTKVWDKRFGGTEDDKCKDVLATADGGYLLAGYSKSAVSGDKTEGGRGNNDYWAVKIDANGTKEWDKRFGGSAEDFCNAVVTTADGGYLLAGGSRSGADGDKSQASQGGEDYWVVKINANGGKVWDKRFGGGGSEVFETVVVTSDGGFLLVGQSDSNANGDKTEASRGSFDMWAVKINANGDKGWDKRFGGNFEDWCRAALATTDGGYLLAGFSESNANGDKSENDRSTNGFVGGGDFWVVKIESNGTKVWDKIFGGSGQEDCRGVVATSDGGYLLAGYSNSGADGDKTETSRGGADFWVIKVDADGNATQPLAATDGDGDSLTWSVLTPAGNGTATVSGTGASPTTFSYQPDPDFNGTDSFVVQVTDGSLTDVITVDVNVTGAPDVSLSNASVAENQSAGTVVGEFSLLDANVSGGPAEESLVLYNFSGGAEANATAAGVTASSFTTSGVTNLGTGNGNPSPGYEARAWLGGLNAGRYFTFTITNTSDSDLTISSMLFDARRTPPGTGPTNYAVRSSADAFAANLKQGSLSTGWTSYLADSLNYVVPPAGTHEFRIIGWGANNQPPQGGHFNLDNVSLNGSFAPPPPTYALVAGNGSTHNNLFQLDANGTLKTNAILDYEANATLSIRVRGANAAHPSIENVFIVNVTNVNDPPVITSYEGNATVTVNALENQPFGGFVLASDADGNETVSYSITGGADANKFDLNATTGVITFKTNPDYEIPTDADTNNTYEVTVMTSDGEANATQAVTIAITNILYEPVPMPAEGYRLLGTGKNDVGQLGDGTTDNKTAFTEIFASGIRDVATGAQESFTLIVKIDGSLWAVGENGHGQLGLNDTATRTSLTQVLPNGVKSVSAGTNFSAFLKEDG